MCNLYRLSKGPAEIARLFGGLADPPGNAGETVYPGYPGYVLAEGRVRQMTWGFPLALKGKSGQLLKPRPVNNARADKLDCFMWRYSFQERRCLIPVTAFCEAEGEKGAKTRTWFSLPGEEVFAVAGIWRDTAEWGPAFSMVMTEACEPSRMVGPDGRALDKPVHDRMPAILPRRDWADWFDGPPDAAGLLCRPFEGGMTVLRTEESWVRSGLADRSPSDDMK